MVRRDDKIILWNRNEVISALTKIYPKVSLSIA
jgi:hypothetical protein